jgi:formamidopyrimidine-DNA glycosylase
MPELPEVETVRLQLKHKVVGKTIAVVEVFHMKTVAHDRSIGKKLAAKTIADIDRVGKLMIFSFKHEDNMFLLAHLKMTGQFFFVDKKGEVVGGGHSLPEHFRFSSRSAPEKLGPMTAADTELPTKHTRVAFRFTDGTSLYFNDMRLFGYTKLANAKEVAEARTGFGPEPIDPEFDIKWFSERVRKRSTPVKAALLDQSFVAGLGNIYVDEALWRAQVKPERRANTLSKNETIAIAIASRDVMLESIKVGGTTFQHFVDTGGNNGNFTDYLKVFGKQNTPCERCGGTIKKIRLVGRGTHYCPKCQK